MTWRIKELGLLKTCHGTMTASLVEYDEGWRPTGCEATVRADTLMGLMKACSGFKPDNLGGEGP